MSANYKLGDPVPRRVRWISQTITTSWGWTERHNQEARCSTCPDCGRNFISGTRPTKAIGTPGRYWWKKQNRCNDCLPEHLRLQKNARQQRYRERHRHERTAQCSHCGKDFSPLRSTARFCSNACRVAAHRTARRET